MRPRPAAAKVARTAVRRTGIVTAPARPARGMAVLAAMVLLTVVATLASSMVWAQWRAVQIEQAERARIQATWILAGALDWAKLILREHRSESTSLHDAWAQPLAEARLSTFLAADRDNTLDSAPEAFLSGRISDMQDRYNLTNLIADGKVVPAERKALERLCEAIGVSPGLAATIANRLADALAGTDPEAPLLPARIDDLAWLGVDATSIEQLRPWVSLLPERTPVNLNTAERQVLAAVIEGIDQGTADRLVQSRQRKPFRTVVEAKELLPGTVTLDEARVTVRSTYFEVRGRIRLEDRVLEERSLVHRRSASDLRTIQRERISTVLSGPGG